MMNTQRHWRRMSVAALSAGALALALSACGGSVGTPDAGGTDTDESSYTLCMMPKLTGISYFDVAAEGFEEAAAELGVESKYDGPATSVAAGQVEIIDQWVAQSACSAITISANDADAVAPSLKAAAAAGIKTSGWDADPAEDAREVFVEAASVDSVGAALVEQLAAITDGKGEFLVLQGELTHAQANLWGDAIKAYMAENYPEMSVAETLPCHNDLQVCIETTKNYVQANPDVAGIFAIDATALPAAGAALEDIGKGGQIALTGLGLPGDSARYVDSGTMKSFVLWDVKKYGYLTAYVMMAQLDGTLPTSGTLDAGSLGAVTVNGDRVVLGEPLVFDSTNVHDFDF